MAFVTHILPERVLSVPKRGAIQFHPSLLPRHRGRSALNWAIVQGETETGLTIFWVDAGIDTGPILLQERVPIDPDDTVNSLYFNRLFQPGVEALVRATRLVAEGSALRIAQDEAQATYEPPMDRERAVIDWELPARDVYNLIRGCNRQPGAWSTLRGQEVTLLDCQLVEDGVAWVPGQVEAVADGAIDIGLRGGLLRVSLLRTAAIPKLTPAEAAVQLALQPGDRFRAPPVVA